MAITNGYCTLAEIKSELEITDSNDDTYIEGVIEGVSRWIDGWTKRRFYAVTETRYYSPEYSSIIDVDDLLSVTTLKTDPNQDRTFSDTWETTDYDLLPLNEAANGWPYTYIETTLNGQYTFPLGTKTVEIAGSFGFCALANVPSDVYRAAFLGTLRLIKRDDTPLGIAGSPTVGPVDVNIPSLTSDPDIIALIQQYRKLR